MMKNRPANFDPEGNVRDRRICGHFAAVRERSRQDNPKNTRPWAFDFELDDDPDLDFDLPNGGLPDEVVVDDDPADWDLPDAASVEDDTTTLELMGAEQVLTATAAFDAGLRVQRTFPR